MPSEAHALADPVLAPAVPSTSAVPAVAAVRADDVSKRYGDGENTVDALRDVSLEVSAGRYVAVMGPSGSGKSTLMHLLAGLDTPSAGEVSIGGVPLAGLSDRGLTRLRREHIGFVFQSFNLLPTLSAEENIVLPLQIAGRKPDRAQVENVIERVGLGDRRRHRPSELSGGQQQRVAIARALVTRPTVLFADEPTGNLDSRTGREILDLLRDAVDTDGQTLVMVTHDPRAATTADRVVFLADGEVAGDIDRPTEATVLAGLKEVSR